MQTLTPEQEAKLDCVAYPFQPDWHTMLCVAALQQRGQPVNPQTVNAMALPDLNVTSPVVQPLLPVVRASQLLLQPMTALGIGGRLACEALLSESSVQGICAGRRSLDGGQTSLQIAAWRDEQLLQACLAYRKGWMPCMCSAGLL